MITRNLNTKTPNDKDLKLVQTQQHNTQTNNLKYYSRNINQKYYSDNQHNTQTNTLKLAKTHQEQPSDKHLEFAGPLSLVHQSTRRRKCAKLVILETLPASPRPPRLPYLPRLPRPPSLPRMPRLASPRPPRLPRLPRPPRLACLACPTRLTCSAPENTRFAASPRLLPRPTEGQNRRQKLRIPRAKLRWSEMQ